MKKKTEVDFPFDQVLAEANDVIEAGEGNIRLFQKFTCGKCNARLTMEDENTFYTSGTCDQCGHVTNLRKAGCNYLIVARVGVR